MESTVECPICTEVFNRAERRPKALPCGHTVCLYDLQDLFRRHNTVTCPFDSLSISTAPDALPDNRAIISLLDSIEVHCWPHDTLANSFCLNHVEPLCESCDHPSTCTRRSLPKDFGEVSHLVIGALSSEFEVAKSFCEEDMRVRVNSRFTNLLRVNLSLLRQLREEQHRRNCCLSCEVCCQSADGALEISTFQSFCKTHVTTGWSEEGYLIQLKGREQMELCEDMKRIFPLILKKTDFYALNREQLELLVKPPPIPQLLQQLGKSLLSLITYSKGAFENAPGLFYCPQCLTSIEKSTARITILPCFEAYHAICSQCAALRTNQRMVICPLDGSTFNIGIEKLQTIPAIRRNKEVGKIVGDHRKELKPFPVKAMPFKSAPGELPPQIEEIAGELPRQIEETEVRMESLQRLQKSPKVVGSPLPPPNSMKGVFVLDRFPSVLPPIDIPVNRLTPNQRGWKHVADVGQVEALIFTATESVTLIGFGLGTPIDIPQASILLSIRIYRGDTAIGNPLFSYNPNHRLIGGPHILSPIYLDPPVSISPYQKYTLKLHFQGDPNQDFDMFKGNQYEKPEFWCGEDGTIWEFEECVTVERSEFLNGQNNLSGPILRILYKR